MNPNIGDRSNEPTDEEFERHLRSLGVTSARPERIRWKWQQRRDKRRALKFIATALNRKEE